MKFIFSTLKKTLFWSYERGSWQYDVMCVLILAFIFLTPNSFFDSHQHVPSKDAAADSIVVPGDELGSFAPGALRQTIEAHLSRKLGHRVTLSPRIDRLTDDSGKVVYLVRER
jgi:hypothetical protein